jgi:hypothetical protein
MTPRASHLASDWLTHAAAAAAMIVTLVAVPRLGVPMAGRSQERGIAELASLMSASSPSRDRIDENIRSWSRFPPKEELGRTLSMALASCPMPGVPDAQRLELARRLYAITNGTDVSETRLAGTLAAFEAAAGQAGCAPRVTLDLLEAVRETARTDPRPRADWW